MDRQHDSTFAETETLKEELSTLKKDLRTLRDDLGDVLRSVVDLGKSGKIRATDEIEARLDQLKQTAGNVRHRGEQAVHAFEHKVEEHPLSSVLIAFGIGVLAGHLIRRKF